MYIYIYKGVPRSRIVPRLNVKTEANSFSLSLSLLRDTKVHKDSGKGFFFVKNEL